MNDIQKIIQSSSFKIHPGTYIYAKTDLIPDFTHCFFVAKDADEITVVAEKEHIQKIKIIERNKDDYRLIELNVSLPFYAVGFIAAATKAISSAGANNLIVSTYSKDYVLVRTEQLEIASKALQDAGFKLKD